ncbi:hypothetical protein FVE85_4539 [Porphyridium purpureum]|uniref:Gamma-butyrobetaine hydroxylase-like N-terminal domain-containing protein n=1 Tax=Porphyridium purpureum TaxID=35688 RepID=A0A5J4YJ92_PORPP|nr:hypothetical protein FVE85_4539 [Porphyridium purpureum]|eukprot:POR8676..scf297_16
MAIRLVTLSAELNALAIVLGDGAKMLLPAELLRVYSKAERTARERREGWRFPPGKAGVRLYQVKPVGRYGVQCWFDDLHSAGIYTWPMLLDMTRRKRAYMREYLSSLREDGLTRHVKVARASRRRV